MILIFASMFIVPIADANPWFIHGVNISNFLYLCIGIIFVLLLNFLLVQSVSIYSDDKRTENAEDDQLPEIVMIPVPKNPSLPIAWLMIISGIEPGKIFFLKTDIDTILTIGRPGTHNNPDIVLKDPLVSRRHAMISFAQNGFYLRDLDSNNGVFVNGKRISYHKLYHGDDILVGEQILRFVQVAKPDEINAESQQRLQQFDEVWGHLAQAVRSPFHKSQFETHCSKLLREILHNVIGYSIEQEIPLYRGIYGFIVEVSLLWIRHSRFPILCVSYDQDNSDILLDIVKQLEIAKTTEYFALLIVVPTNDDTVNEAQELHKKVSKSVYKHDFVVLDRQHLISIIVHNSSQRLIEAILDQGVELAALSPYITRGPVSEKMFFGREQEIKTIVQGISSSDYAIVGGRRMGKSSTLLRISRILSNDRRYRAIYINCEDLDNASDFFLQLKDDLSISGTFTNHLSLRTLVKTVQSQEPSRALVLLMDEIDALLDAEAQSTSGGQLFKTLRVLSHEGCCRFVFSGSRILYQHLHTPQSPFFNFCTEIVLKPLEERSVTEIISKPMHQLGIELAEEKQLISQIVDLTACHPNLVQWICDGLVKTIVSRRVTLKDLERIASSPDFLCHFVETAWGEARPLEKLISLLTQEPAFEVNQMAEALMHYGISDQMTIRESLAILQLYSLIERNNEQYRFVLTHFPRIVRAYEDVDARIAALHREMET